MNTTINTVSNSLKSNYGIVPDYELNYPSGYRVFVDSNCSEFISNLIYYLQREKLLKENHEHLMHLEYARPRKPIVLFIPLEKVEFLYKEYMIKLEYRKTQPSTNFHNMEVRYDQFIIESLESMEHLNEFLDMVKGIDISDEVESSLSKFLWTDECWTIMRNIPKRLLSSIYFHQKDKIVQSLQYFLEDTEAQKKYESLGIPYKKVFLFHGIPGTGKTSFIQALASHFNYNLCVVQSNPKTDDNALEQMISRIRKRSFLVFEDIDSLVNNRETSHKTAITFGGILNMLDGIGIYDKLVVFITTNLLQEIAPAFRRRIDHFIEFGYMQKADILEMHQRFFETSMEESMKFYNLIKSKKITPNTLEKYFMNCLGQNILPNENIKNLDEYNATVSEKSISNLYN